MNNSKIAIINGKLFINNKFKKGTLLIHNERIYKVIETKKEKPKENGKSKLNENYILDGYKIIDATNCIVSFGFFDPHVHLRTPGFEYKEDWESGTKAAIKGGFTYIVDMPNTNPPSIDLESLEIKNNIAKKSKINYGLYIGLTDENSSDIGKISSDILEKNINLLGIKVFLGSSTGSLLVKNESSIKASLNTRFINLFHCEDETTLQKYKDIEYKTIYDYAKIRPDISEVAAFYKIIKNGNKDSKIYICHISSKRLAKEIKKYRRKGYKIIAEISPHHLYFCNENIENSNLFKVNPPIRKQKDLFYLRKLFNSGFFDIVGSDHAPHTISEKESTNPPSGMPGLETTFYVLANLYQNGSIKKKRLFKLLTSGYKIFSIKDRGEIKAGNFADITIVQKKAHKIKNSSIVSKAKFSPYNGMETNYSIKCVIVNGEL
jgi:dihydroorotase